MITITVTHLIYIIVFISGIFVAVLFGRIMSWMRSCKARKQERKLKTLHQREIEEEVERDIRYGAKEIVRASYGGEVWKLCIADKTPVKKGDTVLVYEAMKMEMDVSAPESGYVKFYQTDKSVCSEGDPLFAIL